jgi:2-amino-4-hydroxy-6-hydroxymethyldihydropteridine diphosphokinase
MTHTLFISFGSNLGNRAANFKAAWESLAPAVQPVAASMLYETDPWGFAGQGKFLNQVIKAYTDLAPLDLLAALKALEVRLGRIANFRYGPRFIDIDILFYDDLVYEAPELKIPHVGIAERAFVLVPLADLAPDMYHPVLKETISALLKKVDCNGVHAYYSL